MFTGDHGPGVYADRDEPHTRDYRQRAFTVGIGGPVGSGKTVLLLALCRRLRDRYCLGVVTNDIFTKDGESSCVTRPSRPAASPRSRPAAARTPRSATTSAGTSPRCPS